MKISDFVGIVKELSFSDIRHEAMIPPRMLIVSDDPQVGNDWRDAIFGHQAHPFVEMADMTGSDVDPLAYDAIISIGPLDPVLARDWANRFRRTSEEMRLVEIDDSPGADPPDVYQVQRIICDLCRDRVVAIGRYLENLRPAATAEIVSDTSRVNAQFAALSNIPAIVPVVGNLVAASADFLVLTKNQMMMMYRLAAIYDRDLDDRWRVYSELAPIVGAGFLWRTTARQAAALLPVALGAVPKVAIAYGGTFAIGQAARAYYEHGIELSSEDLQRLYKQGVERVTRSADEPAALAQLDRPVAAERSS
jgi:uncharacterized protein (DUF697 family)